MMKKLFFFPLVFMAIGLFAQELEPTTTEAVLKVLVENDKKKPQTGQVVTFTSLKDGKKFSGTTGANGKFSMLIPTAQKYTVEYKLFTTTYNDLVLKMPFAEDPYTYEYTITATLPKKFTLDNVFFDSGKSTLRTESGKELDQLAEFMSLKKSVVIEIAGHTDNVGTPEANLKLSQDRANAVKQYLVKKGITPERVKPKGYGDTQPIADNGLESGKQKNRRTEVHIVSE